MRNQPRRRDESTSATTHAHTKSTDERRSKREWAEGTRSCQEERVEAVPVFAWLHRAEWVETVHAWLLERGPSRSQSRSIYHCWCTHSYILAAIFMAAWRFDHLHCQRLTKWVRISALAIAYRQYLQSVVVFEPTFSASYRVHEQGQLLCHVLQKLSTIPDNFRQGRLYYLGGLRSGLCLRIRGAYVTQ